MPLHSLSLSAPAAFARSLMLILAALLVSAMPARALAAPMQAFAGEREFQAALERWSERVRALPPQRARHMASPAQATADLALPAAPMAESAVAAKAAAPMVGAAATASDGITNVQTAGVDEGGIVKRAGAHLVILRRGRLFTVRVGGNALAPVAAVHAYAPGADPSGAWYDELLVSGNTVVVIGYSYARGGTEVGLFELGRDGSLSYRATWHLRSGDYYSSRNYASRLLGNRLVMYTPLTLQPGRVPTPEWMPGFRRWHDGATPPDFRRILPATRIYRSGDEFDAREPLVLHTVTSCDIQGQALSCEAHAVLGPASRVFYVSHAAVYVWTAPSPWRRHLPTDERDAQPRSAVFRVPLDGGTPGLLKSHGAPIDALSFLEDGRGHLNVLLREDGRGEGMWAAERGAGRGMALLRVPLSAFDDRTEAAGREHYRRLPAAPAGALYNRFVGDWLLWGGTGANEALALSLADDRRAVTLETEHTIERIEALGGHALLVGRRGSDLGLSAVRLKPDDARIAGSQLMSGVSQSESRTHGFFYRPTGAETGLLGLPVHRGATDGRPPQGGGRGTASVSVMFMHVKGLALHPIGQLSASSDAPQDDGCRASCVDWYGQSRPLFLDDRILALMGYELVEGTLQRRGFGERLQETRRVNYLQRPPARERSWPFE